MVAFLFGAVIGPTVGANAFAAGAVTLGGYSIANMPQGVAANGIDISAITAAITSYMSVPKNVAGIWRRMYTEMELMPYMRKISGQTGKYSGFQSSNTEVLQAFQKAFTAKGTVSFTPYISNVFRLKVDFLLDNIDEIVDGYLNFMYDETKTRAEWPIAKYIIEFHLVPSMIEELNTALCRGSYVAPTPGTAGNSIDSMDGLQTIIADEITATNLVPIVTGAIASTDAVDKLETFADAIDPKYANKGGVILCSKTVERYYKTDYRASFGTTNDKDAKNNTKLDNYNISLVGVEGWGTSHRLLFTPTGAKGNLLYLYDKIFTPKTFQVQQDKRDVVMMADFHSGAGFNTLDEVFVNDQA